MAKKRREVMVAGRIVFIVNAFYLMVDDIVSRALKLGLVFSVNFLIKRLLEHMLIEKNESIHCLVPG